MKMCWLFQAAIEANGLQEKCIYYFSRKIVRRNRIRDFPLNVISR